MTAYDGRCRHLSQRLAAVVDLAVGHIVHIIG
jgi:hypothetical protein